MKFGGKEAVYTLWMIDKYGRDFVEEMKEKQRTIIKRSAADYDDFILQAKSEIVGIKNYL